MNCKVTPVNYKEQKIISGKIFYTNGSCASNIVLRVEKITTEEYKLVGYIITNEEGEFLLEVDNSKGDYKLFAFKEDSN